MYHDVFLGAFDVVSEAKCCLNAKQTAKIILKSHLIIELTRSFLIDF